MRIFLILSLITLSTNANNTAVDKTKAILEKTKKFIPKVDGEELVKNFKELGKEGKEAVNDFYDKYDNETIEYIRCNEQDKKTLSEAYARALKDQITLSENIDLVYDNLISLTKAPTSSKHEKQFRKKINCIGEKLKKKRLKFKCSSLKCHNKYLSGFVSNGSKIGGVLFDAGTVQMCMRQPEDLKASTTYSTFIHEISHLCLTKDHRIIHGIYPRAFNYDKWPTNAGSYGEIYDELESLLE